MKKSPFICKYAKKVVPLQADYAFLRNNGKKNDTTNM